MITIAEQVRRIPIEYPVETVISSGQNLEDVIINRAFRGKTTGFYIDVGAGDPNWDSVTHWFYRNGWSGINVEPNPIMFQTLLKFRPRDINVNVGISSARRKLSYCQVHANEVGHGWGLSSFSPDAKRLAEEMGFKTTLIDVETLPLSEVYKAHGQGRTVDFLKVDVEGFEREVLLSVDFAALRPTLICIEAVTPLGAVPTYDKWEDVLQANGYVLCLFDGLNNYYVKADDVETAAQLQAGININDKYRKAVLEDYL